MRLRIAVTDNDWFRYLRSLPDVSEVSFRQPSGERTFRAHPQSPPSMIETSCRASRCGANQGISQRFRVLSSRIGGAPEEPHLNSPVRKRRVGGPHQPESPEGPAESPEAAPTLDLWEQIRTRPPGARSRDVERSVPTRRRLGQGTFRLLVMDNYRRRCAVTGEKALPVLDAARIRPVTEAGHGSWVGGPINRGAPKGRLWFGSLRRAEQEHTRNAAALLQSGRSPSTSSTIGLVLSLSRSEQMARIRPRDTKPEILLRRALWSAGLRYRIGLRTPAGRPDLVFVSARVAVYVDGCQWHGCPLHYVAPRTGIAFWSNKLRTNVERDRRQTVQLEHLGWRVVRFWEHEIFENIPNVIARVKLALSGDEGVSDSQDWRVVHVEHLESNMERRHLQSLRNSAQYMDEVRYRTTTKWKRPHRLVTRC